MRFISAKFMLSVMIKLICFLFTDIRGERSKPVYAQIERKTGQLWDGKKQNTHIDISYQLFYTVRLLFTLRL